jgi:hypothetical protein
MGQADTGGLTDLTEAELVAVRTERKQVEPKTTETSRRDPRLRQRITANVRYFQNNGH